MKKAQDKEVTRVHNDEITDESAVFCKVNSVVSKHTVLCD